MYVTCKCIHSYIHACIHTPSQKNHDEIGEGTRDSMTDREVSTGHTRDSMTDREVSTGHTRDSLVAAGVSHTESLEQSDGTQETRGAHRYLIAAGVPHVASL
jgi:hypothetical protein